MTRPTGIRKPERIIALKVPSGDDARLTRRPVAMFVQPTGIDRYHVSARLDAESAYRMRNLMFDEGNFVSRLGTDFLGDHAASFVVQVVDVIRQGKKKVTIRFCTRHIEIYSYALGAWTSYPVPLTGDQDDFFAYTGWANKLLFSNGVDGLWEFDLQTRVVALVPGGPSAKHLTTFGNRVVASSTIEDSADWPYRVRWTAKNDYKRWAESTEAAPLTPDLVGGHEDLFGSPGGLLDEAMGVFPYSDEQAWLVRSRSVWQMSVSGNVLAPFRFSRILADIGSPFRQSIVSLASGVVFLSRDNIHHLFVEGQELLGQPIVDEIAEEVTDKGKSLNVAFGAYDVGRSEYRLALGKLVWRYRFIEKGWTLDEYPWEIKALGRQIQGITGLPIDALEGIIDDLTSSGLYPPGSIDSLVKDRSTDNAMMFVPVASTYVMVETDDSRDHLLSGEPTDGQLFLETGVLNLDALKGIELHGIHGEYEAFEDQDLIWEFSENDGFAWNPLSMVRIEITEGSEMFFLKQERRSRKLRIRMKTGELGKLRLLGIAPELVNVERTMAARKPKPAAISILPSTLSMNVGGTQQLSWQVLDSSGRPITGVAVSFFSSNTAIATVSSSGLVRALAAGPFSIVATVRNIQSTVQGTVIASEPAPVAAVIVTPEISQGNEGTTQQFTATLRDAQNNILVGRTVVWASSTPGFATINSLGVVTLVAEGVTIISATVEGVTGAATLTVLAVVVAVATVEVLPATFSGEVGDTFNLVARPKDLDGNVISGKPVTWSTSSGSVASVSATGVVTLVGSGSVTITATCESTTGTSAGTSIAAPAAVATVTVTPGSFTVFPGTTQALTVVLKDSLGAVLTGRVITFASSNSSIATVNSSGIVTGVAVGSVTITVASEGKNGFSTATVAQSPVASVTIAPLNFSLVAGNTVTLVATPRDSSGNALAGRVVTWGSSDVTKATVNSAGVVTGVAAGSVTITATSETKFGTSLGTITTVVLVASPLDSPSTAIYVPRPAMWTLPIVSLETRYNRGGTALTWASDVTVTDSGNPATNATALQGEIDAAATRNGHSRIKLPNGWIGNRIRLRKHTLGPFWTYIEAVTKPSSEGVRPATNAMGAAPQIRSTTATETGAVWCDLGADYTRFTGIRFLATTGSPCYRLLYFQGTPDFSTENADTTAATLPQWMIVDRCWVDGGNVSRVVNGISANTREFACVDSVIDGCYYVGIENHGINGYNALGPWKIVGNAIEAGSISVLVGGSDPRIVGLQTSDIEVRRNYMYKRAAWNLRDPVTWDGVASKVVKNLLEFKWGDRILVEGNVFENSFYGDNQIGAFLVWKVENSLGGNVTVTTQNVTYRFNRAKNVAGGYEFQGVGVSAGPVGSPLHRVHHQHNLVEGLAPDTYVGGTTRAMFLNNAAADIVVDHDTLCLHQQIPTSVFRQPILFAGTTDEVRLVINNSLLMVPISSPPAASDSRGIFGDGSQTVSPDNAANTLAQYAPGYSFLNNVMVKLAGSVTSGYPPTSRYTDTIASVGCVSPATGNFALTSTSPYKGICADGSDPGCDMTLVNTATAGVAAVTIPTSLPVIPGLVGFGTTTPAGRGGTLLWVTNRNDSGPGSLRAAVEASGPRVVVFEVSGTITLLTKLVVTNPFLTIAGQSAPAPGILCRNWGISIRAHDVLVQHLRFRVGDTTSPGNNDGIEVLGPTGYNVVFDHCSSSWGADEDASTWFIGTDSPANGAHDVTFYKCIIAENLHGSGSGGLLIGDHTKNFALLNSLMIHEWDRNPYFKGDTSGVVVNTLVYNWSGNNATYVADPGANPPAKTGLSLLSVVGNVYKRGPNTPGGRPIQIYGGGSNAASPGTKVWVTDNRDSAVNGGLPPSDPWTLVLNQLGATAVATSAPVWPTGLVAASSGGVVAAVSAGAGAFPTSRDAVDTRLIADVTNGTGQTLTSQNDVGGFPTLANNTRTAEAAGLPANPNADDDSDGYTNLEEWLQSLAAAIQ